MRIVNIGSANIDYTYAVDHFVRPGETLAAGQVERAAGGKGLNQSISLARAGCPVWHAGRIGRDGEFLRELCRENGIHTEFLETVDTPTGNATIQVVPEGENAIILYGGANRTIDRDFGERILAACGPEDILVLQNEISCVNEILEMAARQRRTVALNPAPMDDRLDPERISAARWLILNETEAEALSGETAAEAQLDVFRKRFPDTVVILTVGREGAWYQDAGQRFSIGACPVTAVDTTAAGDTFIGFFLGAWIRSGDARQSMRMATKAAALAVSRPGAVPSIPYWEEVQRSAWEPAE